jgi:hypothetical protein
MGVAPERNRKIFRRSQDIPTIGSSPKEKRGARDLARQVLIVVSLCGAVMSCYNFLRDYASFTGEFSHIKHQIFDNGMLQWAITYENTRAILTVEIAYDRP